MTKVDDKKKSVLTNEKVWVERKEKDNLDILTKDIKALIESSKRKVASSINIIMLETYWNIGKLIISEEVKSKSK